MSLQQLFACCQHFPQLATIPLDKLTLYITLLRHLKPQIEFAQTSTNTTALEGLPLSIHNFLQLALDVDYYTAQICWTALRNIAWNCEDAVPSDVRALLPLFLEHGDKVRVRMYELLPPVRQCIQLDCEFNSHHLPQGKAHGPVLKEANTFQATLFTRSHGAIPVSTTSTYCRGCLTRYHYDCYVQNNVRTYYSPDVSAQPSTIQVNPHFFVETELCEYFASEMHMAWTSAQNCSRLWNEEAARLPWATSLPLDWPIAFELNYELVGESFIIHSLLNWHRDHDTTLQVDHKAPTQAARWNAAITEHNQAMAGTGQPGWNHACDLCTKHVKDADGNIVGAYRSVVTDGVSLGHPCCGVHDCKQPLDNNKHHYCRLHQDLRGKCAIIACQEPAEASFRTCALPDHRACESWYLEHGKAMFQLQKRLDKLAGASSSNATHDDLGASQLDQEEVVFDEAGNVVELEACDGKPATGNRKVFARFGRRRTHNEQLCVASCGVILGRATFYGAEGPNSVRLFWLALFPTKNSLPSVMWYDNNCHVAAMLAKEHDTYFENVALPVDVFHFKSKHKERDEFRGRHCNPALWAELIDEVTGSWVFNSSAAEQVNRWLRGYHSMTHLMRQDRYNFFLDEMIMRRNHFIISQLEAAGHAPYDIPREALLGA